MKPLNNVLPIDWFEGYCSISYLRNKYLQKGSGEQIPKYESLIIALELELRNKSDPGGINGIEKVFNQTSLSRFELLDSISYAIEHGHIEEKLFSFHPFENELDTFQTVRNSVLYHDKNAHKYTRNISLDRRVA